jgi:hypothetical protein
MKLIYDGSPFDVLGVMAFKVHHRLFYLVVQLYFTIYYKETRAKKKRIKVV